MSQFPEKILLPSEVFTARKARRKAIMATAFKGVFIRITVVFAEFFGFFYFGSNTLLVDALATIVDIGISLFLIFCIKLADKPPDRHHPFGHGRFEPLAGLQLGIFLAILGSYLAYKQLFLAIQGEGKVINSLAWIIPLASVLLLELGYRHLKAVAVKQNSPALQAEAVHYRMDGISSLFAVIALAFAAYFPGLSDLIDHIGACCIALFMIVVGVKASKENLNQVLDRIPDPKYFKIVDAAAKKAQGVLATEKIRIQAYGPDAHINIDIEVDPKLSVEEAHAITQQVRLEIQKAWPSVRDVIVHVEPYYEGDHLPSTWS